MCSTFTNYAGYAPHSEPQKYCQNPARSWLCQSYLLHMWCAYSSQQLCQSVLAQKLQKLWKLCVQAFMQRFTVSPTFHFLESHGMHTSTKTTSFYSCLFFLSCVSGKLGGHLQYCYLIFVLFFCFLHQTMVAIFGHQ